MFFAKSARRLPPHTPLGTRQASAAAAQGGTSELVLARGPRLRFVSGARLVPDASKRNTPFAKGEDAFFITPGRAFGVADGVGWWSLKNIDAGMYSRSLMKAAADHFALDEARTDPIKAMLEAEAASKRYTGTCTFCTVTLQAEAGEICGAVMGDAGFMLIRFDKDPPDLRSKEPCSNPAAACAATRLAQGGRWKVVYKSQEQQVRFNMPLAVGTDSNLTSKSAVTVSLPVRRGDIILAATDGVFDNLFLNDILQVVSRTLAERAYCGCTQPLEEQVADAGRLADAVTDAAVAAAMHPTKRGPFAAQCEKSGYAFDGGKMDDITAVVALVTCDVD